MYSIGTINEMMSYISTMISYALLCIRVAEVVYSRHQKWKDITGCALAGHSAQKKIYCAKLCPGRYVRWYQASLTERKFCRRTISRTGSRPIINMSGCEVTAEHVPLARMPAVVVVSYSSNLY